MVDWFRLLDGKCFFFPPLSIIFPSLSLVLISIIVARHDAASIAKSGWYGLVPLWEQHFPRVEKLFGLIIFIHRE